MYDFACASVVTKKSLKEFKLLDYTLSRYHNVKWYISTDPEVYEVFKDNKRYVCLQNIDTDDNANHCGADSNPESKKRFMHITTLYSCKRL